jgi:hypothetical protein
VSWAASGQQTGTLAELLANDDTPFIPDCTLTGITIVSSP